MSRLTKSQSPKNRPQNPYISHSKPQFRPYPTPTLPPISSHRKHITLLPTITTKHNPQEKENDLPPPLPSPPRTPPIHTPLPLHLPRHPQNHARRPLRPRFPHVCARRLRPRMDEVVEPVGILSPWYIAVGSITVSSMPILSARRRHGSSRVGGGEILVGAEELKGGSGKREGGGGGKSERRRRRNRRRKVGRSVGHHGMAKKRKTTLHEKINTPHQQQLPFLPFLQNNDDATHHSQLGHRLTSMDHIPTFNTIFRHKKCHRTSTLADYHRAHDSRSPHQNGCEFGWGIVSHRKQSCHTQPIIRLLGKSFGEGKTMKAENKKRLQRERCRSSIQHQATSSVGTEIWMNKDCRATKR